MSDKAAVIGQIRVELIKKHGKIERIEDNLVTGFGKSFVLANGLATLFAGNTTQTGNKITFGDTNKTPGPYFPQQPTNANLGYVTNLLLNNPTLAAGQGFYLPGAEELVASAYADSGAGATRGIVTELKAGTQMRKCLTRRYVYGTSVSGQFDTIATLLTTPDLASGRMGRLIRLLSTGLSTDIQPSSVNLSRLHDGKIMINMSDSSVYEYDMLTGVLTLSSGTWTPHYFASTFIYNDNLYIIYSEGNSRYDRIDIVGYNSAGVEILAPINIGGGNFSSGCLRVWYDNTTDKVYLNIDSSPSLAGTYEFTTSAGVITGKQITSDSITIPSFSYGVAVPVGEVTDNIYTFASSYFSYRAYLSLDGPASANILNLNSNGPCFMLNNRLYAIAGKYITGGSQYMSTVNVALTEYGNLLSYHTFSTPFIKDVGDELYVSYSYYID